jgi:hypothetical protein
VASITVNVCFGVPPTKTSETDLEQRTSIKFLKLGKTGNEIREILIQGYGDNATKKTAVYRWVKSFFPGKKKCHGEIRTARKSRTVKITGKFRQVVRENRRLLE